MRAGSGGREYWSQVWLVYANELRMALRERNTIINSLLIPILLYPGLIWLMTTIISYVEGKNEGLVTRVQMVALPPEHAALRTRLAGTPQVRLVEDTGDPAAVRARVAAGQADLAVLFTPPEGTPALPGDFRVHLLYNGARDRSGVARDRVDEVLQAYRADWLRETAHKAGITETQWEVTHVEVVNIATEREVGTYILGMLLPVIFVVMVAIGCFYPAIDATAGERERQTWESLMATAVPRGALLTAKYLMVATFGWLAGLLNLAAMTLTMQPMLAPLLGKAGVEITFALPLAGLPIIAVGSALLAGFIAAGMMLFAAFARTFKDGQAMITPLYMACVLPALMVQGADLTFTMGMACLPIANVAMVVREAITGVFHWPQIAVTALVSAGLIAGCLWLATAVLRAEEVLVGAYDGSLLRFIRQGGMRGACRDTEGRHR